MALAIEIVAGVRLVARRDGSIHGLIASRRRNDARRSGETIRLRDSIKTRLDFSSLYNSLRLHILRSHE